MGTGKTETGRALAELLGLEFVDTDALIESQEGATIAEIFRDRGEDYFRSLERDVCRTLTTRSGLVVASGGGMLVDEENFAALHGTATLVLLEASIDAILERIGGDDARPLLSTERGATPGDVSSGPGDGGLRGRLLDLLAEREPAYHRISLRVDTTEIGPVQAASRIAPSLEVPSRTITIRLAPGGTRTAGTDADDGGGGRAGAVSATTRVEIGRGLLSKLGDRLGSLGLASRAFVLAPENVGALFGEQICASLEGASIPWRQIAVRDGDSEKRLEQAGELVDDLASLGADRDSVVVAVGGGVTGDIAGFVASTYMRGVPLVHVPTTLLAQVDSSIGGKTAVNAPTAKNLIGTFYQPHLTLSDPCVLRTLPDDEIANGMAEVVKTALIGSPDLFTFIEERLSDDPVRALRETGFLERCVWDSATVKAAIVERDPCEVGERRVLNLGHTLGHAFEAAAGYSELTHGQAVSIGLVAAVRIAVERGLADEDLLARVRRTLELCRLPVAAPEFDEAAVRGSLGLDKKKRSGRLHFVLPLRPGSTMVVDDVSEDEMLAAVRREKE
jgi:3-dehydroquinate synthase